MKSFLFIQRMAIILSLVVALVGSIFPSTALAVLPGDQTDPSSQPQPSTAQAPSPSTSQTSGSVPASTPTYCFTASGDAIETCSRTKEACEANRDMYISKGGVVPPATKNCTLYSSSDNPYPRYCAGVRGMNPDVCFESRNSCKSAYQNLNQRDPQTFPLLDLEGENATKCLEKRDNGQQQGSYTLENPLEGINTIFELIDRIVGILVKIALPIAFAIIVWTGFKFVVAQGNPEKLSSAKKSLKFVVIGLCLLLAAKLLTSILASTVYQIIGR